MKPKHPMQPLYRDRHRTVRFKPNKIIEYLLKSQQPLNLNQLATIPFPKEDREQLAQLIGYSICGFGELSYVRNSTYEAAARAEKKLLAVGKTVTNNEGTK